MPGVWKMIASEGLSESDLTARARIREAAIACFADEGFEAPFRTIAQRAGVSPGLITHHFGSKAKLRDECDVEVFRRYRTLKADGLADPWGSFLAGLTSFGVPASLVVYLIRAIQAGGRPAQEFMEHLIDSTREAMTKSVATGLLRPSRDEEARLRYLTYQAMGGLLIQFLTMPGATPEEFVRATRCGQAEQILPMLEVFTEGLFTTRKMLDDYLDFVVDPPRPTAGTVKATASTEGPAYPPGPSPARKTTTQRKNHVKH